MYTERVPFNAGPKNEMFPLKTCGLKHIVCLNCVPVLVLLYFWPETWLQYIVQWYSAQHCVSKCVARVWERAFPVSEDAHSPGDSGFPPLFFCSIRHILVRRGLVNPVFSRYSDSCSSGSSLG